MGDVLNNFNKILNFLIGLINSDKLVFFKLSLIYKTISSIIKKLACSQISVWQWRRFLERTKLLYKIWPTKWFFCTAIFSLGDLQPAIFSLWKPRNVKICKHSRFFNYWTKICLTRRILNVHWKLQDPELYIENCVLLILLRD